MVTQKDIARQAGVNRSTVSAALSDRYGSKYISEEKRDEIKRIAREMGYEIDDMARSIKTGKSRVIGFISSMGQHVVRLIEGICQVANENDYTIKIFGGHPAGSENRAMHFRNKIDLCVKSRVSAVIVHGGINHEAIDYTIQQFKQRNIELGFVSNLSKYPNFHEHLHVTSNDATGIHRAVEHLYELGHRKIFFIALARQTASMIRANAFLEIMNRLELPCSSNLVTELVYEDIPAYVQTKINKKDMPTAFICSGDNVACSLKDFLQYNHGLQLPRDISIVGFGNLECGQVVYPQLTTVYEPFEEMGRRISEKLIARVQGRDFGTAEEFIETHLIIRGSTAAPLKKINGL